EIRSVVLCNFSNLLIYSTDLIKHIMLKPIRLSAKCYDKHFAILITQTLEIQYLAIIREHLQAKLEQ
ncbi:MAG: hypothetical protein ACLS67_25805, partial [Anaerobutyricum soehngenii]